MKLLAIASLALLISCKSSRSKAPPPQSGDAAVAVTAADAAAAWKLPTLPGALYFRAASGGHHHEHVLVRLANGEVAEVEDVGADVFPSTFALPDGRIVGIASKGDGSAGSEQLVLIARTKVERIGPAATQIRNPAVDPAGKWIVVESKIDPASQLYSIDLATQKSTQLTTDTQGNFAPSVLDATSVVFTSSRDGDSELYRIDLATKKQQRLTAFHRDDWSPRVQPIFITPNVEKGRRLAKQKIAFLSDREGRPRIFVVEADGTKIRRLTTRAADVDADEDDPIWSPDGKSIAYTLVVPGKPTTLWLHDVVSGKERVLTPVGASDIEPAFSPDGKWIATVRTADKALDLWAISVDQPDAAAVRITNSPDAERLPRWHLTSN